MFADDVKLYSEIDLGDASASLQLSSITHLSGPKIGNLLLI